MSRSRSRGRGRGSPERRAGNHMLLRGGRDFICDAGSGRCCYPLDAVPNETPTPDRMGWARNSVVLANRQAARLLVSRYLPSVMAAISPVLCCAVLCCAVPCQRSAVQQPNPPAGRLCVVLATHACTVRAPCWQLETLGVPLCHIYTVLFGLVPCVYYSTVH